MSGQWMLTISRVPPIAFVPRRTGLKKPAKKVRDDGALWFSLRLTQAPCGGTLQMGPERDFRRTHRGRRTDDATGRTALRFVLDARKSDTIGTDILVPEKAFAALEALPADGIEISDAGLAVEGESRSGRTPNIFRRLLRKPRNQPPAQFRRAVPSLSRPSTMESVSRTIAFAWGRPRHASDISLIWR